MTSSWWRHLHFEHSQSVRYFTHYFFTARRVLNSIASCEKNEQVQQADLFKPQTVTFIFQHIFGIHLSIFYHTCQQASDCLMQKRCWLLAAGHVIPHQQHFLNHQHSANFLHVLLVSVWIHLRLNGIGTKSLCKEKTNDSHHDETQRWCSELNSLRNVYFWFFIFGKLTEWYHFVTYLWNDPGITVLLLFYGHVKSLRVLAVENISVFYRARIDHGKVLEFKVNIFMESLKMMIGINKSRKILENCDADL